MKNFINRMHSLRARLGAKWCVVLLLIPPTVFGIAHFGPRAGIVVGLSVLLCMAATIVPRLLSGKEYVLFHPGAIITGLLIGLTLSAETPLYMIVVGALVAQLPGKFKFGWLQRNPLNPAALGRTAIAILEYLDPTAYGSFDNVDVATSASALFKEAGGHARPVMSDLVAGFHPGAIGETSEMVLIPVGILMLCFVVIKRHAAIAMILTVPLVALCVPAQSAVVGHAPWIDNPLIYLFASNTMLLAIFFVTDPMTTPQTRWGGVLFGVGVGVLGVLGRRYTAIPGAEMYAVLIMNFAVVVFGGVLFRSSRPSAEHAVETFYEESPAAELDDSVPAVGRLSKITSPHYRQPFSVFESLVASGNRKAVSDILEMSQIHGKHAAKAEKVVAAVNRKEVLDTVEAAGLRGCGGARFPVHLKWKGVLKHNRPRVLIANGQEGEPETFKDRHLMEHHAHLVVEGIAIAALVIDAKEIIVVVTSRCEPALAAMKEAVADFEALPNRGGLPNMRIVAGPDLYVCGEETALIEFLESNRGEPRLRPPMPVESGLNGRPTLVQNVETLSWLPSIVHNGAEWFRENGGIQLVSLSGAVKRPGIYEVTTGTTLRNILAMGGGMADGQEPLAIAVGGPSGGFLPPTRLDLPFDHDALRNAGTMMGTGSVRVLSASDNVADAAMEAAKFFRQESCGRCTPCRVGTSEIVRLWEKVNDGSEVNGELVQIKEVANVMRQTSTCGLGAAASARILSVLEHWPPQQELCSSASEEERTP